MYDAMADSEGPAFDVLFVCVHNSGRSQMAEAFVSALGAGSVSAGSAGTQPASRVSPVVREAMLERNIDVSWDRPKALTEEMVRRSTRLLTMGCALDNACPAPVLEAEDWGLRDSSGLPLEDVRMIRDEIEGRVGGYLKSWIAAHDSAGPQVMAGQTVVSAQT